MNHRHSQFLEPSQPHKAPFWRSRYGIGLVVFGGAATYFLVTEHRAHLFGALPFLLLLACPAMHIFMHGGHGQRNNDGSNHGGKQPSAPPVSKLGEQP